MSLSFDPHRDPPKATNIIWLPKNKVFFIHITIILMVRDLNGKSTKSRGKVGAQLILLRCEINWG